MPPRKPRVSLVCMACGGVFERLACQLTQPGQGRYCSRDCHSRSMQRGTELHCALCDSTFYRALSEQDVGLKVNQFCSRPCYMEWRAINRGDTYPKNGHLHVHRIVAAAALGRPLTPGEVVHHIDLDKTNNRPDNLAVFPSQSHHARCHAGGMADDELGRYRLAAAVII